MGADADRKNVTWQHLYKYIYTTEECWPIGELFDFNSEEKLIKISNGYAVRLKKITEINDNNKNNIKEFLRACDGYKFQISGDADFGMKYKYCEKYIKNADKKMHMFPNFSIMPVTGGMNNKKGHAGYNDRFDIFIYYLKHYYETKNIKVLIWFGNIKEEYKEKYIEMLKAFLNLFKDEEDYCKKIYLIDDKLVHDLIENGRKAVEDNEKNEKNYCDLATRYWEQRKEKMKKIIPENEHKFLDIDINDDIYK